MVDMGQGLVYSNHAVRMAMSHVLNPLSRQWVRIESIRDVKSWKGP